MSEQVFEIGREQFGQIGGEMALNPNIPSELFVIIFKGIDFKGVFDSNLLTSDGVLDLLREYAPRFEQYNPYAYALGYFMSSVSRREGKETAAARVFSVLSDPKMVDYYGVPIGEITTIIDVVRYSRFVDRLLALRSDRGGVREIVYENPPPDADSDEEFQEGMYTGDFEEEDYEGGYNDEF